MHAPTWRETKNKKTLENFHLKRRRLGVWSKQRLFCPFSLFVQTSHHYFLSHHETLAQEPHTRSTKTSKHELKLENYQSQEFPSFTLPFFLFYHVQRKFDESSCLLPEHWVYTLSFRDLWISLLCSYFNHVEIFSTIIGIHEVSSQKAMGSIFH
jgi:hypothetical protein